MRCWILLVVLTLSAGCSSPLPPTPVSTNRVCPTGCVIPPGCHVVASPPHNPVGYHLVCS